MWLVLVKYHILLQDLHFKEDTENLGIILFLKMNKILF